MFLATLLTLAAITVTAPVGASDLDDTVLRHPQSDHITCLDCGANLNLNSEVIERLKEELREREGFTVRGHTLRVNGYCRACTHARETRPQDDLSVSLLFVGVRRGISDNLIDPSGLEAARVRIHYPRDDFFVRFEVELETGTPHVFDFHLGTELFGQEALIGRFETPLTRSAIMERERLFFLDRSIVGSTLRHRDGVQLRGRGERLDWWLAVQEGATYDIGEPVTTARVAIHLMGGGADESTEGAWGSAGDATLTLAAAFQDDRSRTEARRAAFEAFWAYDRYSASVEVLDNDANVGDSSPWSATATSMLTSQLEAGLRFEDDELKERTTLALSQYLGTRSSRWSIEVGQIRSMSSSDPQEFLSLGFSLSF
jgi:hypothetical protein